MRIPSILAIVPVFLVLRALLIIAALSQRGDTPTDAPGDHHIIGLNIVYENGFVHQNRIFPRPT